MDLTYRSKQDEQSKKQADNTIQDSDAKIKMKKREIAEHEANLEKEEKVLEGIRDGLKGGYIVSPHSTLLLSRIGRQNASLSRTDRGEAERATAVDCQD
jgi:hypothetical protein